MQQVDATDEGDDYDTCGGSGDREAFLSLYESVWGARRARWFDWRRFVDNPFTDRVELVIAECAGRVVGAEPLLALPLATPAGTVPVRQPVDWIVHSDHRQCGLFTRMTEQLLSTTAERARGAFVQLPQRRAPPRPPEVRLDRSGVGTDAVPRPECGRYLRQSDGRRSRHLSTHSSGDTGGPRRPRCRRPPHLVDGGRVCPARGRHRYPCDSVRVHGDTTRYRPRSPDDDVSRLAVREPALGRRHVRCPPPRRRPRWRRSWSAAKLSTAPKKRSCWTYSR